MGGPRQRGTLLGTVLLQYSQCMLRVLLAVVHFLISQFNIHAVHTDLVNSTWFIPVEATELWRFSVRWAAIVYGWG